MAAVSLDKDGSLALLTTGSTLDAGKPAVALLWEVQSKTLVPIRASLARLTGALSSDGKVASIYVIGRLTTYRLDAGPRRQSSLCPG